MVCLDFIYSYLASVIDCGQTFVGWFIPNNVTYLLMIWTSWQWNTFVQKTVKLKTQRINTLGTTLSWTCYGNARVEYLYSFTRSLLSVPLFSIWLLIFSAIMFSAFCDVHWYPFGALGRFSLFHASVTFWQLFRDSEKLVISDGKYLLDNLRMSRLRKKKYRWILMFQ